MIELLARTEALLRRGLGVAPRPDTYRIGKFTLVLRRQELQHADGSVPLTSYEYKVIRYFCEHRGEIVERDELLSAVWGFEAIPYTRTVDTHIALLRKKLEDSRRQELIITVRGRGYKLVD